MSSFRAFTAAIVALAGLTACSSGDVADEDTSPSGSSDGPSADAYPVTISTKFGDITIEEQPERIVALGWGDAETALALGVQPIGASDWLDFGGEGVGPWAEDLYDEAPEIIETNDPSFEQIAALEPDLILDVRSSGDQDRYDKLSAITTTVGVPEGRDSFLTTTEEQVETISAALGVPDAGDALIDDVNTAFANITSAHPDWAGQSITAASKSSEGWGAYSAGNARVKFMEKLGFVFSPTIAELPDGSTGRSVKISPEQVGLLDADLIIAFPIWIDASELTDDPSWLAIPAVADDRAIIIGGDLQSAYSLGSTMSIMYALDQLEPLISEALD